MKNIGEKTLTQKIYRFWAFRFKNKVDHDFFELFCILCWIDLEFLMKLMHDFFFQWVLNHDFLFRRTPHFFLFEKFPFSQFIAYLSFFLSRFRISSFQLLTISHWNRYWMITVTTTKVFRDHYFCSYKRHIFLIHFNLTLKIAFDLNIMLWIFVS